MAGLERQPDHFSRSFKAIKATGMKYWLKRARLAEKPNFGLYSSCLNLLRHHRVKGRCAGKSERYHNLVAHPKVTVEIGSEKFKAKAREAKGEERDRLFNAQAKIMPQFNEYADQCRSATPVPI